MEEKILNDNDIHEYEGVYKVLVCQCGSNTFEVYQGSYLTVIQCTDCAKRYTAHEG